ncbi:MAG: NADH:ubiquinone oxidoreductase subunit 5 (subunit L)/multisubunit Na+/H+ antiporter MnhA subunit [Planctomycetaceae bacterium]|jgi:NADH:ubiquinone oxidoreductase subunit 5 (subunit L)/multisubunit Na+/H+ antiporter MnhA subunit
MGSLGSELSTYLLLAWMLPLLGFGIEVLWGYTWGKGNRHDKRAAYLAVACIGASFALSLAAFFRWDNTTESEWYTSYDDAWHASADPSPADPSPHDDGHEKPAGDHGHEKAGGHGESEDAHPGPGQSFSGTFYTLATFGDLTLSIDYYIDSLTILMFCMVTLIATCIHIFAVGYMSDELTDEYVDHNAHTSDGKHVHRPGRFHRFFSFMSLFCFSMLGIILAGNIFQVFVFWELVGISSFLLIGFYTERKSANVAANKAFIVNRVGDFGFIIGLMILWTYCGSFSFGDYNESVLTAEIVDGGEMTELGDLENKTLVLADSGLGRGQGTAVTDFGKDGLQLKFTGNADTRIHIAAHDLKGKGPFLKIDNEGLQLILDNSERASTTAGDLVKYLSVYRVKKPGLFSLIRGADGKIATSGEDVVLKTLDTSGHYGALDAPGHYGDWVAPEDGQPNKTLPYFLLVIAGLGVFGGCIGKSAQFPLQTWLPDAMEGPTPVSALVHSATMVAAGVYLAARFYPVFTTEVLLTIAYIGCITAFVAATIAVVATDIKRVLAYSTMSQLGYMMLAIGLGGWAAGLFHLITHAFFKSLMFLCSGSVIHGCHHEQEMTKMGGLRHKMPITAYTMLIGVIAIAGLAIPGSGAALDYVLGVPVVDVGEVGHDNYHQTWAFSGFHSKDAIVATALAYMKLNPVHFLLFLIPLVTAGITAFYMFRLWFYTFTGKPRDQHVYDHCHESPIVMFAPLLILSVFAAGCAFGGERGLLYQMIGNSEPLGVAAGVAHSGVANIALPSHHEIHDVHGTAGVAALLAAALGTITAFLLYCRPVVNPETIKTQFSGIHGFLVEKWQFDNLYDAAFVRPAHVVGRWCAGFDRNVLDWVLHSAAKTAIWIGTVDKKFDEKIVDGLVNVVGNVTRSVGMSLTVFQTGQLRQYVMFIAISVVALFALLFAFMPKA